MPRDSNSYSCNLLLVLIVFKTIFLTCFVQNVSAFSIVRFKNIGTGLYLDSNFNHQVSVQKGNKENSQKWLIIPANKAENIGYSYVINFLTFSYLDTHVDTVKTISTLSNHTTLWNLDRKHKEIKTVGIIEFLQAAKSKSVKLSGLVLKKFSNQWEIEIVSNSTRIVKIKESSSGHYLRPTGNSLYLESNPNDFYNKWFAIHVVNGFLFTNIKQGKDLIVYDGEVETEFKDQYSGVFTWVVEKNNIKNVQTNMALCKTDNVSDHVSLEHYNSHEFASKQHHFELVDIKF